MLIQGYDPRVAGSEKQLQALVPLLARRGVEVVVVTRREPGLAARGTVAGGPVYRMPTPGGRVVASSSFTLAGLLFLLRRRRRIDVLHAHDLYSPATTAVLGKLFLRRPVAVTLHVGGARSEVAVLRSVRSGPPRLRLLPRFVDRFIAISDELEHELRAIGVPGERLVRIPNGVDAGRFRPADPGHRCALRQALGLEGHRVALFLGRLASEKGLDRLLEAWPAVRRALPDALLLLAGGGPQRDALEARWSPGVRFLGWLDDPVPHLQAADCFVLPSDSEGLPIALLEAMASGLPCVATSVGGVVDVLRPGVEGWLVPRGDTAALAAALSRALAGEERERFGRAARARAVADFSLEATAESLSDLYRQLVHGAIATRAGSGGGYRRRQQRPGRL